MPGSHPSTPQTIDAAYQRGRRVGLATAALALTIVSFLNLLGTEKSILAAALASDPARRLSSSRLHQQTSNGGRLHTLRRSSRGSIWSHTTRRITQPY